MSAVQVVELELATPITERPPGVESNESMQTSHSVAETVVGPSSASIYEVTEVASHPERVFEAITPVITSPVTQTTKFIITSLLITANIIQVIFHILGSHYFET